MPITEFPAGGLGAGFAPEEWAFSTTSRPRRCCSRPGRPKSARPARPCTCRASPATRDDWYAELEEIGEGCPPGDDLVLTPKEVAALCTLSNEVVADANAGVLDSVGQEMLKAGAGRESRS